MGLQARDAPCNPSLSLQTVPLLSESYGRETVRMGKESEPPCKFRCQINLVAVLNTHYHADHSGFMLSISAASPRATLGTTFLSSSLPGGNAFLATAIPGLEVLAGERDADPCLRSKQPVASSLEEESRQRDTSCSPRTALRPSHAQCAMGSALRWQAGRGPGRAVFYQSLPSGARSKLSLRCHPMPYSRPCLLLLGCQRWPGNQLSKAFP